MIQFDQQAFIQTRQLCTKALSLSLGRRLWYFQQEGQGYWLKTQLYGVEPALEDGFQRELEIYHQLSITDGTVCLPHQSLHFDLEAHAKIGLLLPAGTPILAQPVAAQMSIVEIQQFIMQLAQVMDAFHQAGYIHGDLKSEHFIQWQGQIKLLDFEQSLPVCQSRVILTATPRYMAPELFHGACKSVASDWYALGIILLQWLTGQKIPARSYQAWAYLHCQQLKIELPEALISFKALLVGLLAKQNMHRVQNFQQLKALLVIENV